MTTAAGRRRRVLLVTVEFRTPPMRGREHRYWQHVMALRSSFEVGVLVFDRRGGASPSPPDGLSWWGHSGARWPDDPTEWMRRSDRHPAYGELPSEGVEALDEAMREFDPDVVVAGGLWFHGHLERLGERGAHVVLDAADVEGPLLRDGLAPVAGGGERMVRRALARHVGEIEGRAVASVDQVWVCSEHDARAVRTHYPQTAPVVVVPNTVDTESLRRPAGPRPDSPAVVYPASFGYVPNYAAAMTLIGEVHPLVRGRFPTATLSLVGVGAGAALRAAAAQAPGVTVTGPVPDTRPWLWGSTVLAVPLRAGSGTRIKILESFAASLPVVTTAKGAEGLDVVDGEHVVVAESPRDMADAIVSLHEDPAAGSALAARARHLVETRYSTAVARHAIESALVSVATRTR